ncbi:transcription elongation factor GreA [Blochmannia endosymbiont of Colobopsis nipponica]|uniref:transcription elongation factor GreA n=1 Tax=Blochmannia endosymbiont of Colobopsis nipponica TaxID=2681987 RepID=UPI0017842A66|nr:transcription elongation factor GreA [Blochmannia endosymbiont of Colobopsis nipponica]QOI10760.1 transcription elongation factor GreA [Blochmannia endosymbiont of Colobopsis nipponica]
MNQIPMTVHGMEKLRAELNYLKNIRRSEIIKVIAEAREHGDLKENAEYHAAREQQGFCEGRIQEIEAKLANAHIIDITKLSPDNVVIFGSTVTIENLYTKHKKTYRIVGDDEANFRENMISINSPIARGLIGKREDEIVIIKTPGGLVEYKILIVKYI